MDKQLAELKRFLDRMSSEPQRDPAQDEEDQTSARALGLIDRNAGSSAATRPGRELLIEMTRRAIRDLEPVRPADQSLEAMSAPPAMPVQLP